jgi:hypothetical protein
MEITYDRTVKAICEDGRTRTANVRTYAYDNSMAADTYFSVPAFVRAHGRTVRGYVSREWEDADGARHETQGESGRAIWSFRAYTYCRNHALVETTIS